LEDLGFLKLDILGLKTLDVIADSHPEGAKCLYNPEEYFGPWDDPAVYSLFAKGRTKGVFQLESPLGKTWCKKIKPKTQGELSDLVALIRPAVLEIGMADDYVKNRAKPDEVSYIHTDLERILSDTYGCQIYQEQMLEMVKRFAGFDLAQADAVRKAVGKKNREKMAGIKDDFIDGVKKVEGNDALAEELWTWIEQGAEYGFNKSHSMCYGGVLGYITAYMKVHYPENFILSLLKFSKTEQDSHQEIMELFFDAKLFGINLKPPSTKKENIDFERDGKDIYFGLSHIKHIGASTIKNLENVGNLPWSCVLLDRGNKHLKRDVFLALILSGAFDHYGLTRKEMRQQFEFIENLSPKELPIFRKFLEGGKVEKTTKKSGDMTYDAGKGTDFLQAVVNFKDFLQTENKTMKVVNSRRSDLLIPLCTEFSADYSPKNDFGPIEKAGFETYYLSVPLTCSEVDIYDGDPRKTHHLVEVEREYDKVGCCIIALVNKVNERADKKGRTMAFIGLQDKTYQMDAAVFSHAWLEHSKKLEPGKVVLIEGKKNRGGFQVIKAEELI
jgi:DNA polymerase III alpha subunit